ncbi:ATP/maltotriose-dependent transcriptional regulator MalT [Catenulispora sp. GP43]|uniref:LuxR C-terminal-related transcriptional regulator n=1 Tax=Catenulispora sp. GP43 TaxID=3156263 RepID=UPI0035182168
MQTLEARCRRKPRRSDDSTHSSDQALELATRYGHTQRIGYLRCLLAGIAAVSGDEDRCRALAEPAIAEAQRLQVKRTVLCGRLALARLEMSLGRYEAALDLLESAAQGGFVPMQADLDLVEAAVRIGQPERAVASLARMRRWNEASGRPWVRAVALRCEALMAGDEAEPYFREALCLHGVAERPFDRARTDLLYGRWLRRAQRKAEARPRLRAAAQAFDQLGAAPWAERARAELRATGETAGSAAGGAGLKRLTAQELQVVRLAATGLSNREIGAQLYLSPRTVGYHLYKIFPKLGIASRGELTKLEL